MSDLTAEQIQQGRGLDRKALAARRRLAHEMRSVRERIASTSGLGHAFDVELLRQFAQAQISAVPLEMILLGSITAIAVYWIEPATVLRWVIIVLIGLAMMVATGRRLLATPLDTAQKVKNWRWCFVLAQTLLGACWSLIVGDLLAIDFGLSRLFLLFVVIMVSAVTAMLAETVPLAVVFGLVPVSIRLATLAVTQESLGDIVLAADGRWRPTVLSFVLEPAASDDLDEP